MVVPALAVVVVAVAGVVAAVMANRTPSADPAVASSTATVDPHAPPGPVIQAPPLKSSVLAGGAPTPGDGPSAARTLGAAGACRDCGVVEMVVAVRGYGQQEASTYQMHIRMDDGTTRTLEQRGALAPGSRVRVQGSSVRALTPGAPKG